MSIIAISFTSKISILNSDDMYTIQLRVSRSGGQSYIILSNLTGFSEKIPHGIGVMPDHLDKCFCHYPVSLS